MTGIADRCISPLTGEPRGSPAKARPLKSDVLRQPHTGVRKRAGQNANRLLYLFVVKHTTRMSLITSPRE
jgi:hypothetical protein